MTENIIINDQVVFEPEANRLFLLAHPETLISLPESAGRCLSVLIKHHGDIVTMTQFHEEVWSRNNIIVSGQSVYQNISLIRKALTEVGEKKNIIETRTRRGWLIPADISLECQANEDDNIIPENDEGDIGHEHIIHDSHSGNKYADLKRRKIKAATMSGGLLLLTIAMLVFLYNNIAPSSPVISFKGYRVLGEINGCHIYRNQTSAGDTIYMDLIRKNNLTCGRQAWWYITNYPPSKKFSVVTCLRPLHKNNPGAAYCTSHYFFGLKDYSHDKA